MAIKTVVFNWLKIVRLIAIMDRTSQGAETQLF